MNSPATISTPLATQPATQPRTPIRNAHRLGAIGGLVFVATIVAQNVTRGLSNVSNNASGADVVRDFTEHRSAHWALAVMFVVGAFGLVTFVATLWNRLRDGRSALPVRVGVLGVVGILALFATTVGIDVALTSYVHLGHASPDVARGLWMLHNGVFSILMLMIAIALVGFTFAAVAGRLIGARWRTVGAIGAGLLLLSPFAAPAVAEGSPVFAISGIGFVLWIVSLIRISVALWNDEH